MLRHLLLWIAVFVFAAGVVMGAVFEPRWYGVGAVGLAGAAAVLYEARRHRARLAARRGGWELTNERFVDPATGHVMQGRYNRGTGERDQIDLGPAQP